MNLKHMQALQVKQEQHNANKLKAMGLYDEACGALAHMQLKQWQAANAERVFRVGGIAGFLFSLPFAERCEVNFQFSYEWELTLGQRARVANNVAALTGISPAAFV